MRRILIVGAILAGLMTGCAQPGAPVPIAPAVKTESMDANDRQGLVMNILLIASMEDELRAGKEAWILVEVKNPSTHRLDLRSAFLFGKGGKSPNPRFCSVPYYSGFAVAQFNCEFIGASGRVEHEVRLDPPDEVTLAAGERHSFWRRIKLPPGDGTYTVKVRYDEEDTRAGLSTVNFLGYNTFQGRGIMLECTAQGVRVQK